MKTMTVARLADWAGGRLAAGDPEALVGPDVISDSRAVTPGALFVAFAGERVDGHEFCGQAASEGAAAALVTREVDAPLAQVVVDDTIAGISSLARNVVADAKASGLVVAAITGSSGKTSTKDLIAQVLEASGPTVAPVGSFNNEIGAPLTACKVDAETRFLVAEMGARGLGHISWLSGITPPTIGAVINVGHAHIGEFGSQDAIAQAKGELVEALGPDGWAVLNADDPRVAAMAARTPAKLAFFSTSGEPASGRLRVWASDIVPDDLQRYAFTLNAAGEIAGRSRVGLRVLGEHSVANALAAATVALCAGLSLDAVAASLSHATARSKWRMQLDERADGLAVLNDAYNANPDSMAAALRASVNLRRDGGRVIVVLGDMLELGPTASEIHEETGRLAAALGIDELVGIGRHGADLARGFEPSGRPARYWTDKSQAAPHLAGRLTSRDVVLVKASRGVGLESVAEALLREGAVS